MVYRIIFELPPEEEQPISQNKPTVQYDKWTNTRPRITAPPSFLARIPFQMVTLATVIGLCFLCGQAEAGVQTGCFSQVIDHSDAQNPQTFCQRYWKLADYYNPKPSKGQPMVILLVTSFGGALESNSTALISFAQGLGAMVFEMETRYTGKSIPVTTKELRYDSVDQHVEDLVRFITNTSLVDGLQSARWVLVGSLFDGAYSTWFRSKFSGLAFGSISFSPYLVAVSENADYDTVYQNYVGTTCATSIHNTVEELLTYFRTATPADKTAYEVSSGCSTPNFANDTEFFFVVSQLIIGSLWNPDVCKNVTAASSMPTAQKLENFAKLLRYLVEGSGATCETWNIADDTGDETYRSTFYLMCSQLGQFQTPAPQNALIPSDVKLEWYEQVCQRVFNGTISGRPDVTLFNAAYGGSVPTGCNMVFVTSTNDPYRSLGPDHAKVAQASPTNQIITVNCPDPLVNLDVLMSPTASDRSCISNARNQIFGILQQWQVASAACAVPHHDSGDGGDGSDAAIAGTLAAIAGIILGVIIGGVAVFYATRYALRHAKRQQAGWQELN